jgi:hypothetical protein
MGRDCGLMESDTDSKLGIEFWFMQNAASNLMLKTQGIKRGEVQQPGLTVV